MIAASAILQSASEILNDEDYIRWTKEELIGWINHASYEVVVRRPAAGANVESFTCDAGVYQIVDNAIQVLDVIRNVGGRPIERCERFHLDASDPDWMARKAGPSRNFCVDERLPNAFWIYPQAEEGHEIQVNVSRAPGVNSEAENLDLAPEYLAPILNFVLWRALGKDSEYANGAVAATYYQAFEAALGTQNQVTVAASAKQAMP